MIQQIIDNPALPVWWGKNQSGMQAKEELSEFLETPHGPDLLSPREQAKKVWLESRDQAIEQVKKLNKIGLHKQIANRILEPWFNIRIILSGTEFENFFALRAHPDAQPEIQALAYQMLQTYNQSTPKQLNAGEWHIPFSDNIDEKRLIEETLTNRYGINWWENMDGDVTLLQAKKKIAVARCARISYFNYEGKDDYNADILLCERLFGNVPRHLSPTEHVAEALSVNDMIGNFKGFKQFRYSFSDQNLKDNRVKKHE